MRDNDGKNPVNGYRAMDSTEVAIVGAGPVGIEMAVALKQLRVPYRQFESGAVGSTVQWYAPGTMFFSSPERISLCGVPLEVPNQLKATREQYLSYLRTLVRQFELQIDSWTEVSEVAQSRDGFMLTLRRSYGGFGAPCRHPGGPVVGQLLVKKLILATGDMHEPQLLGAPGEDLPHVSHYFADPHSYFGAKVLIVGGRNSAVEAALRLFRAGVQVSISYRGENFDRNHIKYWLLPEINHLIKRGLVPLFPCSTIERIESRSVILRCKESTTEIPADFVVALTGYRQRKELFLMCGMQLEGEANRPSLDEQMQSSVSGIYVIGTAAAGTQRSGHAAFIETSHVHVERVARALTGQVLPWFGKQEGIGAVES